MSESDHSEDNVPHPETLRYIRIARSLREPRPSEDSSDQEVGLLNALMRGAGQVRFQDMKVSDWWDMPCSESQIAIKALTQTKSSEDAYDADLTPGATGDHLRDATLAAQEEVDHLIRKLDFMVSPEVGDVTWAEQMRLDVYRADILTTFGVEHHPTALEVIQASLICVEDTLSNKGKLVNLNDPSGPSTQTKSVASDEVGSVNQKAKVDNEYEVKTTNESLFAFMEEILRGMKRNSRLSTAGPDSTRTPRSVVEPAATASPFVGIAQGSWSANTRPVDPHVIKAGVFDVDDLDDFMAGDTSSKIMRQGAGEHQQPNQGDLTVGTTYAVEHDPFRQRAVSSAETLSSSAGSRSVAVGHGEDEVLDGDPRSPSPGEEDENESDGS